jgi:mannopine transport system substrate-binding protein
VLGIAAAMLLAAAAAQPAGAQEQRVVVANTGGAFERALRESWFEPFTAATGIKVVSATATDAEQRARAVAMVQSGRVEWDLFVNVDVLAASAGNRAITQDLSSFCAGFAGRGDLQDGTCKPEGVRISLNATALAFNREAFSGKQPSSWADFWNVEAFPGRRTLPNFGDPWRVLAAALMADGVASDKLFPLDVERAFRKLDAIRPHIDLWWRTGDQTQQGFRNRDYVLGMIWGTRANALLAEKQPVQVSFNQAFLLGDRMQVLKNGPNSANALQLLKFYLDNPAIQAGFAERMSVTPPSRDAIARMSEEARARIPSSPAMIATAVTPDAEWLNANQALLLDRWNAWMQR